MHNGQICLTVAAQGTWPYLSIALLKNPGRIHKVVDDLESTFWVLLREAVNRFAVSKGILQQDIFDEVVYRDEFRFRYSTGGFLKASMLLQRGYLDLEFNYKPLQAMIRDSAVHWRTYHIAEDRERKMYSDAKERELKMWSQHIRTPDAWVELSSSNLCGVRPPIPSSSIEAEEPCKLFTERSFSMPADKRT